MYMCTCSVTGCHSEALSCYESLVAMEAQDVRLGQALALFRARKFSEAAKSKKNNL